MSDWFAEAVRMTGIPSGFFLFCIFAFLLILFLCAAVGVCLYKLSKFTSDDPAQRARQTLSDARGAWREDMGTAATQTKEMVADRIRPLFVETEKNMQKNMEDFARGVRVETFNSIKALQDTLAQSLQRNDDQIRGLTEEQSRRMEALSGSMSLALKTLREEVDRDLKLLNDDNQRKLEKIRETVEEKLHSTLTSKVGESFEQVSRQLKQVYEGLGQMKELAADVGGLKSVLVNVKNRGMLGEVQLEALLSENLAESQYIKNAHPLPDKPKMVVEFAVKLPGVSGRPCLLPIDAKFPVEDYQRVQEAAEAGDRNAVNDARAQLRKRLTGEAKSISEYIHAPETTDFAIMFIPSEGLYAEALSLGGLAEDLFTNYRVYMMGPSTLMSALCAYRAGFQTLAIERKSAEIRQILTSVQTEFGRFGVVIDKLKKQVDAVSNTVVQVQTRTDQMNKQLSGVANDEGQPAEILSSEAPDLLPAPEEDKPDTNEIRGTHLT